jgi:hypothetical protein
MDVAVLGCARVNGEVQLPQPCQSRIQDGERTEQMPPSVHQQQALLRSESDGMDPDLHHQGRGAPPHEGMAAETRMFIFNIFRLI